MTFSHLLRAFVGAGALTAAACATEARAPSRTNPDAAKPPVAVALTLATVQNIQESIDIVGSLAPKSAADVKSEVTGTVAAVFVTEWTAVRAGQPLVRLDTAETEAIVASMKAAAGQAAVAETRARRERDRALELLRYGLITPQAADEAGSALEAAAAAVAAARAQIRTAEARLAKFSINAPMTGVVSLRHVNVGDRVENMGSGDPIFRIVDNRRLELTATVPSSRVTALRVGQAIEFVTDALPDQRFTGRLMFINPSVDDASRSIRVVAEVPNDDGALRGGLFVRGRIQTSAREGVVVVPREALINWAMAARSADVFVVDRDCAHKRAVQLGAVTAAGVEIVRGVAVGESVVTRGAFALRPGDRVTVARSADAAR